MSETAHPAPVVYERRWLAMFILLFASFMNMIDITIVNVALPSLQKNLQATESGIEWVVAAYSLAFALGLLPFGRYGDIIGKRVMFLVGVASFTIASLLCGLAPNINVLILARVVQGLAGAIMTPQVLAIAQIMFPPKERAGAFALFGLTAGLASVAGPVAGGFLMEANIYGMEWRPIFLINLPIGIFTVAAAWRLIPDIKGNPDLKNDFVGIALAAGAIFCLIFPFIEGRGFGWPLWCFVMIAVALALAVGFVFWEQAQRAKGAPELLPVSLMQNGNYMFGTLGTMVFFSAMPGFFLVLAVFLQQGYGLGPLASGLTTLPFPVGVLTASIVSGRLGPRWQRQRIVFGASLLIVTMLLLRHVIGNVGDAIVASDFIAPLLMGGFGTGMTIAPLFQVVLANVPPRDAGSGSGALQAIQQLGGAFGVAIISEIYFSQIALQSASGAPLHEAFKTGFQTAVLYNMAAYVCLILIVTLLKGPITGPATPHTPPVME